MTGETALDRFLTTDRRDSGCGETRDWLDVYVDLALAGEHPEVQYPGIAVHLRDCGPCREDFDGLLAAVRRLANPAG